MKYINFCQEMGLVTLETLEATFNRLNEEQNALEKEIKSFLTEEVVSQEKFSKMYKKLKMIQKEWRHLVNNLDDYVTEVGLDAKPNLLQRAKEEEFTKDLKVKIHEARKRYTNLSQYIKKIMKNNPRLSYITNPVRPEV